MLFLSEDAISQESKNTTKCELVNSSQVNFQLKTVMIIII